MHLNNVDIVGESFGLAKNAARGSPFPRKQASKNTFI